MKKQYITLRTRVCEIEASYILQGSDPIRGTIIDGGNDDVDYGDGPDIGEDDMYGDGMND